jgi:hypothetical protein
MSKQKHKVARWWLSVNEPQKKMLDEMMKEDAQTDVSTYFGFLIAEVYKARQLEKNRRPVGRPRKEEDEDEYQEPNYDDDLPKDIFWMGEYIGKRQMADKEAFTREWNSKNK